MKIPEKFDSIRPFEPEELPQVFDRLISNPQFRQAVSYVFPGVPFEALAAKMRACKSCNDFQLQFCYGFIGQLQQRECTSCDLDASVLDRTRNYTFVSNHRDIVLDSAFLDKLLVDAKFTTTCEIAIGDNLLSLPWVKDLVRINKSFIVRRGLPMREMLVASKLLSEYMHFAIAEKKENIWIAQRVGRAKDSNDVTQEGVLKMMTMAGEGSLAERLVQLHIVPLAISYEYDPCDYLKAAEFQLKRDVKGWKKGPADDIESMRTGIFGYKGAVHYQCAPCIDGYLLSLPADLSKADFYKEVAAHIDHEIHRNYRLYACNYVALDLLEGTESYVGHYSEADRSRFERYLQEQLDKIDVPNKDEAFLRERLLTMYANPARNYMSAQ